MSAFNGTNGLPQSNEDFVGLNYGIRFASPTLPTTVFAGSVGASEMVALQMAVDGTRVVLDVPL